MSYFMSRTMCDVLEEMRKCNEHRNYAALAGLIEEVQTMGNRMEGALYDKKEAPAAQLDLERLKQERRELRREVSRLKIEAAKLKNDNAELEEGQ
jgi:hypothetical protein